MDISLTSIKNTFLHIVRRFHALIFALVVLGGLVFVILTLNTIIISSSTSTDYTPPGADLSFDQVTIDRVNALKSRDEAVTELDLSQGRTNPFIEN
jgi:hypothetical protein